MTAFWAHELQAIEFLWIFDLSEGTEAIWRALIIIYPQAIASQNRRLGHLIQGFLDDLAHPFYLD